MMDCNRDEALRAKTMAEAKMEKKDYTSAKKFAMKAQSLYADLEGLSQMLPTLDVYISAENKISGEIDWYSVLGVNPSADDETVRKQYRKLALVLHPDKNKSVGADGAFKLLSEAWSLLSDKAKRLAYNQRRNLLGVPQSHTSSSSRGNGFHNFKNRGVPVVHKAKNVPPPQKVAAPMKSTFWTLCNRCKMYYEYLKVYLNNVLLCPNCHKAFTASETTAPFGHSSVSNVNVCQQVDPTFGVKERMKRERDESLRASGSISHAFNSYSKGEGPVKKSKVGDDFNHFGANMGNNGYGPTFSSGTSKTGFEGTSNKKPDNIRELSYLETRQMLIEKGRSEIRNILNQHKSKKTMEIEKEKLKETKQVKDKRNMKGHNVNGNDSQKLDQEKNTNVDDVKIENSSTVASMNVPDPDFHDFDLDRTEDSFKDNEVWAAYDDDDGMPRFYALINKVISRKPFKVKLSWLNSKNSEFSPMEWVGSGFYKTCGELRIGKYELNKSINSFSHKVKWFKGPRGSIHILPSKGDVWALFRNWSTEWNQHTPDEVIHKYDMVLVVEDYNEDEGVLVAPLEKVAGFRTIFHTLKDSEKVIRIPKQEMFRFSHGVPHYLLTGEEAENAPKGCYELDPAATPVDLLQVTTEDKETNGFGKAKEESV